MNLPEQKYSRTNLVSFLVLFFLMLGLCFWLVLPFLLSVIMGGIISLMLRPFYQKLIQKKLGPKTASLILTLGTVLIFIIPLILLAFLAVKQAVTIGQAVSQDESLSSHAILTRLNEWPPVKMFFDDLSSFEEKAKEWMESGMKTISGGLLVLVSGIPGIFIQVIMTALSLFVFLLDGERFGHWVSSKIPLELEVRKNLACIFTDTAVSTIWATLGAGAAQSVVMFTAFLVLGVPGIFLASGLTFILAWIPMVGCSPVWSVAAVFLITQGMAGKAVVMVLFGLGAGITDNIVRSWILKGRSKIHPLVSLISIFGGIAMFGLVGVFIGPVLASLLIALVDLWEKLAHRYGLLPKDQK